MVVEGVVEMGGIRVCMGQVGRLNFRKKVILMVVVVVGIW